MCDAPFEQQTGTTGDLPACAATASMSKRRRSAKGRQLGASPAESKYLQGVLAIYRKTRAPFKSAKRARSIAAGRDLEACHLELFIHPVDFKLRSRVRPTR